MKDIQFLDPSKEPKFKKLAIAISIIIPLAVALLFKVRIDIGDFKFLPAIYAVLNGITAFLLVFALIAIKKKNIRVHRLFINAAIICSVLFLVMYILYHMSTDSTPYGGEGAIKYVYFFILITHIILSAIVTPFVCFTYLKGWLGDIQKHKKLTRITYPLWLYVAVSGVVVYLMISPYYS